MSLSLSQLSISNQSIQFSNFHKQGRAEVIRLALHIADIPFEDERIKLPDWPALKPTTPYGSLPTATIDGELVAQSSAIVHYAGKLSGLYPSDPKDALPVDEVLATVDDIIQAAYSYRGSDKDQLKEAREKFVKESVPRYIGGLEKRLEVFGKGPFVCGDNVTIADLGICTFVIQMKSGKIDHVPKDIIHRFPRIITAYDAVMDLPKVKEWYKDHSLD